MIIQQFTVTNNKALDKLISLIEAEGYDLLSFEYTTDKNYLVTLYDDSSLSVSSSVESMAVSDYDILPSYFDETDTLYYNTQDKEVNFFEIEPDNSYIMFMPNTHIRDKEMPSMQYLVYDVLPKKQQYVLKTLDSSAQVTLVDLYETNCNFERFEKPEEVIVDDSKVTIQQTETGVRLGIGKVNELGQLATIDLNSDQIDSVIDLLGQIIS